ncbi:hypothetical protein BHE74_00008961 [Ensete ventricosum]|nr:hypothetical protein BHE74_00008961 [Ensete ventricosum]
MSPFCHPLHFVSATRLLQSHTHHINTPFPLLVSPSSLRIGLVSAIASMTETEPFSVLFVCLGNICRSPAAEAVFTDLVRKRGAESKFKIDSAGTIGFHEVKLMCSFCKKHNEAEVPDPYYGGPQGFEKVLDLLEDACESLLDSIMDEKSQTSDS